MSAGDHQDELYSWEQLASRTGRLEIAVAVIGRQVERITEHLGLVTDEDGTPVTIEPFAPQQAYTADRYLTWWLARIRDIAGDQFLSDAMVGGRVRALLFPRHIHVEDGTVEGCPGCFPPAGVIPPAVAPEPAEQKIRHPDVTGADPGAFYGGPS